MQSKFVSCLSSSGFHRLHYTEWGDPANPQVLVCAHGLTRCGRDFDTLARALSGHYRVICPDVVGRGESDWLANKSNYTYPQYLNDMATLLAAVRVQSGVDGVDGVHWLGTSMGGIIGMLLAAQPHTPVTRLVVNDVGSFIPKASLERIAMYVGKSPPFPSVEAAVDAVRATSPFGPLSDTEWRVLTLPLIRQNEEGSWDFRYDPGVGEAFRSGPITDVDLLPFWNAINCPVLVTRGAESDLLLRPTFEAMCNKANVRGVEFPGVGHAPMFQHADQIDAVTAFLMAP
ncbi:MAG TPA: alpha/beta hydrolase [Usitatibacteraceae bacterium]